MTVETVTLNDHEHLNPSTSHHVEWEALPTKQHLPGDDLEATGTGPDGWGVYLAEMHGDGYFAWLPNEAAARHIVDEHNVLVRALIAEEDR